MGATPSEAVKAACDLCVYVSEPIISETIPVLYQNGVEKSKSKE